MSQAWKTALYDYVRCRNQMEVDLSIEPHLPLLSDMEYIQMQRGRLKELNDWFSQISRKPLGCKSRAKFVRILERENKVIVDLELNWRQEHLSQPPEERVEKERVTLSWHHGQWKVSKVEIDCSELPSILSSNTSQITNKSLPYLNRQYFEKPASPIRNITYNRLKVQEYADAWWDKTNPRYIRFEVDCTNYVSQCLFAGGAPMIYTGSRETGWWYQGRNNHQELWSFSWSIAHSLQSYLSYSKSGLTAYVVDRAEQLTIGDVITYDWDGDSKYQHTVIVTAMDTYGMPLVNAHTTNSKHRFWDYRDSYAWTKNTRYRFLHISDSQQQSE